MKKDVAIVFGITSDYTFALANVLIGMKKHCKLFWDDIIIYHDGVSEKEQAVINQILPCKFIVFDESMFNDEAIHAEGLKNYSLLTLARFECFGLLNEYRKIIWHDVDILVQKDFSSLLSYGDKSGFAATQSPTFRVEQNFFGLMPGYDMFSFLYNAGILVLSDLLPNPSELRIYCYNTYNKYASKMRYNDQSVLNMMIQDYKIQVETIDLDRYCCHPSTPTYRNAEIIHAYGSDKFWNSDRLKRQFPEWDVNDEQWHAMLSQAAVVSDTNKKRRKRNDTPLVSVLMSIYERTDFIKDSVNSILQQTVEDLELIIVVEYSPYQEAICAELEAFDDERIVVIRNEKKLGFAASLNVGIEAAKGTYLARMDDDDISLPERLEKEVKFLEKNPDISVVGGWIRFFGNQTGEEHRPLEHEALRVWAIKECPMFHPTVMIRKTDMDRCGFRYNPEWLTEDYELWLRMLGELKFANIPEVVLNFRASGKNATVEKAQKVQNNHLDLMRRTMKSELGLDFTRDEMLVLRWPHLAYECYNTDAIIELRESVIKRITNANNEKNVYNPKRLAEVLGLSPEALRSGTLYSVKKKLKKAPKFYELLRKTKQFIFGDKKIGKRSLFTRVKMRLLPPSSKSFYAKMELLEAMLADNKGSISQVSEKISFVEQRVIWSDEVVRRLLVEESARHMLTICQQEGIIQQNIPLNNSELVNIYNEYNSAVCILQKLKTPLGLQNVVDLNCGKGERLCAAAALKIHAQYGTDTSNNGEGFLLAPEKFREAPVWSELEASSLIIALGMATEDTENEFIHLLCSSKKPVLFSVDQHSKRRIANMEQELMVWKDRFAVEGYEYIDLRSMVAPDWEVLAEYKNSLCLFVERGNAKTIKLLL